MQVTTLTGPGRKPAPDRFRRLHARTVCTSAQRRPHGALGAERNTDCSRGDGPARHLEELRLTAVCTQARDPAGYPRGRPDQRLGIRPRGQAWTLQTPGNDASPDWEGSAERGPSHGPRRPSPPGTLAQKPPLLFAAIRARRSSVVLRGQLWPVPVSE